MISTGSAASRFRHSLIPLLLATILVGEAACRPPEETLADFDVGPDYTDVDNVELHHVRVIDGIPYEDYKVIMYKEDFVNEDYDPSKNKSEGTKEHTTPKRKYKDIAHRRRRFNHTGELHHVRALKPEKIYFDVLPQSPVVAPDEMGVDPKFDPSKIRFDIIPLVDEQPPVEEANNNSDDNNSSSKQQLLGKRPKKYKNRSRRDTTLQEEQEQNRIKRNPYYRLRPYSDRSFNELSDFLQVFYGYVKPSPQPQLNSRHAVPGKLWNSINLVVADVPFMIKTRDPFDEAEPDRDRVVWGSSPRQPNRLPSEDKRPTSRPSTSSTRRPLPPLFHDSNPANEDWSFTTRRPTVTTTSPRTVPPTTRRPLPSTDDRTNEDNDVTLVTQCVWAIVNCCSSRDVAIRYSCFEQLGCRGAFWGANPCTADVRDNIIGFVSSVYD